jgi:type IV pilus assembly protein PilV
MTQSKNKGFTLLETLIAFVVLTVGLLGAVALQAQAKKASYDSLQRAAALSLGNDILERIGSNDTGAALAVYSTSFSSTDKENTALANACFNAACTTVQLAQFDLEQWRRAIKAQDGTGTLSGATVCIESTIIGANITLTVNITWLGRQLLVQGTENSKVSCGDVSGQRKLVSLERFILMRNA